MAHTVSGLGFVAVISQGLLSVRHHYKWQSWVSLLGCFSTPWLPWGLVQHLQSVCPFDFLIPARAVECWLSMRYSTHKLWFMFLWCKAQWWGAHRCCGASVKTFNMHTSWSLAGPGTRITAIQWGGWVNKCLKFIQDLTVWWPLQTHDHVRTRSLSGHSAWFISVWSVWLKDNKLNISNMIIYNKLGTNSTFLEYLYLTPLLLVGPFRSPHSGSSTSILPYPLHPHLSHQPTYRKQKALGMNNIGS